MKRYWRGNLLIKRLVISLIFVSIFITTVFLTYGAWPGPPWQDLPKLEYIYDSGDTIWFYSTLEIGGFPPRYVVTYEQSTKKMRFYSANSKAIPEDAPIDFHKSKELPSYLDINLSEITFNGNKISIPKLTLDEIERLSKWSVFLQRNRHLPLNRFTLGNAFQGSFAEIDGVYYFGMKGGISEGIGHIGGLVVYSPSENKISILRSKYLVDCSVTGILHVGDELAISTIYSGVSKISSGLYWENGKSHKVGLVLYNTNTGNWRNLSTENSNISGNIIREMKIVEDSIWMITNWGISCYQIKKGKILSWYWSLNLVEKRQLPASKD